MKIFVQKIIIFILNDFFLDVGSKTCSACTRFNYSAGFRKVNAVFNESG